MTYHTHPTARYGVSFTVRDEKNSSCIDMEWIGPNQPMNFTTHYEKIVVYGEGHEAIARMLAKYLNGQDSITLCTHREKLD